MSVRSRSNWNLEALVFLGENEQQTQPTYDVDAGICTRATLVGGECSHHCANLALVYMLQDRFGAPVWPPFYCLGHQDGGSDVMWNSEFPYGSYI